MAKLRKEIISHRSMKVPWSRIRVMYDRASGVKDATHLEVGEPDFQTPSHIVEAAKKALDEGYTHYTPNRGYKDLRESIARKLWKENRIDANPESEILVTVGAMQALSMSILCTVNPGDEVILPDPSYTNYEGQIVFADAIPVPVEDKEENEFKLMPEDVEKAVTKRTKMIMVNTPANPAGAMMDKADLEGIAGIAERYDLLVLSDEAYEKLVYDGAKHYSIASLPGMKERTISLFTFSKTYAMTGWRIGYIVSNKEIIDEMAKVQEYYVSCASAVSQRAALAALEGPQDCIKEMVEEYEKRRNFLHKELNKIDKISCIKPKGTFYVFPNISKTGLRSQEVANLLLEKGKVVTSPGIAFGKYGDNFLRLSFATAMNQLKEAVKRIGAALEEI